MDTPHDEVLANAGPEASLDEQLTKIQTHVVGTGFLVRDDLVLTNQHVIRSIADDVKNRGDLRHWYLCFTYPRREGGAQQALRRVGDCLAFFDVDGLGIIDVGLVRFSRPDTKDFGTCKPVVFGDLSEIVVGSDIGACGFPHGNSLLFGPGLWRLGPVVNQGTISGVAPFRTHSPRNITAFVTDLHTGEGMSGAAVFIRDSGHVIGVHYAGTQATVGVSVPLDAARVDGWVEFFERKRDEGAFTKSPVLRKGATLTGGGDFVSED